MSKIPKENKPTYEQEIDLLVEIAELLKKIEENTRP